MIVPWSYPVSKPFRHRSLVAHRFPVIERGRHVRAVDIARGALYLECLHEDGAMSPAIDLYPPTPAGIPANLTASTGRYRLQVILVLLSLLLFVLLYLGLVAGAGYFLWWACTSPA